MRLSKLNILFEILVLLREFRNILNNVNTEGKKKERRKDPEGKNDEVKDETHVTGKINFLF
jgi:hypothetical protein